MTSLSDLLPPGIHCVLSFDPPEDIQLLATEAESAGTMGTKRLREFSHGRDCAHQALGKLGYPQCPVPVDEHRAPVWPDTVVGSISHAGDAAAAVAAHKSEYRGLGIDLEPREPLEETLLKMICRPEELQLLDGRTNKLYFAKIIFSAKETVYKCVWPTIRRFVDFQEIEIQIDFEARSFHALAHSGQLPDDLINNIHGRYTESNALVISAAYV
jgi:4'-phosphopantetheinyl transferase EntD